LVLVSLQFAKRNLHFLPGALTLLRMRAGHLLLARLCIRGALKGGGESGALQGGIEGDAGFLKGTSGLQRGIRGPLNSRGKDSYRGIRGTLSGDLIEAKGVLDCGNRRNSRCT
jgi:hypothetical protein